MKFTGRIIKGLGEAKKMGFPTLNLSLHAVPSSLAHGVFPAIAKRGAWASFGVAYYGPRFGPAHSMVFEVHCFSRAPRLWRKKVTIELGRCIRGVKKFRNVAALQNQIRSDVAKAKGALRESMLKSR